MTGFERVVLWWVISGLAGAALYLGWPLIGPALPKTEVLNMLGAWASAFATTGATVVALHLGRSARDEAQRTAVERAKLIAVRIRDDALDARRAVAQATSPWGPGVGSFQEKLTRAEGHLQAIRRLNSQELFDLAALPDRCSHRLALAYKKIDEIAARLHYMRSVEQADRIADHGPAVQAMVSETMNILYHADQTLRRSIADAAGIPPPQP